jgi:two-component system, NarL family, invasion response regulator UvrY
VIRVLLVDDSGEVRRSVTAAFSDLFPEMTVEEAANAVEAMALVQRSAFDVVLLDLSLPDRTGLATLRDLRRLRPSLPVVVMTFHPEREFEAAARDAGAAAYVTKGSPAETIGQAVREALGGDR